MNRKYCFIRLGFASEEVLLWQRLGPDFNALIIVVNSTLYRRGQMTARWNPARAEDILDVPVRG